MAALTVGNGEQCTTISAAVAASHGGGIINVDAGTCTDGVLNISHSLTLQAVGGTVRLVGTAQPANGQGLIDEGGAGVNVAITGFDISGATVPDENCGVGDVKNNFIGKGACAENPIAITFGEEGNIYANSSLAVKNNTVTTSYTAHNSTAVVNRTDATASINGNQLYGWTAVASGPASVGGNTTLASEPAASAVPAPAAPDASGDAAITPDTVGARSGAPAFVADTSASVPESLAGDPAPSAAADMAGDVLASYADAVAPSAAASWTDGAAQHGAADLAA